MKIISFVVSDSYADMLLDDLASLDDLSQQAGGGDFGSGDDAAEELDEIAFALLERLQACYDAGNLIVEDADEETQS